MSCKGDTGQGGTAVLSTTQAVGRIQSIQCPTWEMEALEMTALDSTAWVCKIAGDLKDPGEAVITAYFDSEVDLPDLGVTEDLTITFPIQIATNTTPATLVGSGFISSSEGPNMVTGELMMVTITFTYDGDPDGTVPTFTPEAA